MNGFVSVKIHRNAIYSPLSDCTFIRNVSFSQDPSIQSCIWECVHTSNCQTGVYYDDLHICQMYSEFCDINRLQSFGIVRANVICYRKNNNPTSTCPASTTEAEEITTTEMNRISKIMYLPTYFYTLNISKCATWNPNGITVAGNANGTAGSDDASLRVPVGIFIDKNDSLFIADRNNHRIMKYNANSTIGIVMAGNGSHGYNNYQLNQPRGVAIDQYGFLIVGDTYNHRIQNFSNSSYSKTIANITIGTTVVNLLDLQVDNHGNVYVTDGTSAQIVMFNVNKQPETIFKTTNGMGSKADQFHTPHGNFIDMNGHWYIADTENHRVQKWLPGAINGTTVAGISNSAGSTMRQLNKPVAVIVDNNGYIYIADRDNGRIMKWTGNYSVDGICVVGCSNNTGSASNQLNIPRDLKFDQYGNLYVSDQGNHRIQKFMINNSFSTC